VLAEPRTGRFHQIRRHLRGLDHPILGDTTHGDTRANRAFREGHGLPRLLLHCLQLSFSYGGEQHEVRAPLPDDLRELFGRMPWWAEAVQQLPELEAA
jgi:tRNA pseudouridine65 synthase